MGDYIIGFLLGMGIAGLGIYIWFLKNVRPWQ